MTQMEGLSVCFERGMWLLIRKWNLTISSAVFFLLSSAWQSKVLFRKFDTEIVESMQTRIVPSYMTL